MGGPAYFLPSLSEGGGRDAAAVATNGEVAVGSALGQHGDYVGVVWFLDAPTKPIDNLTDLLLRQPFPNLPVTSITSAVDVNSSGEIAVQYRDYYGKTRGGVLLPIAMLPGDFNFDGVVTFADIGAMLRALTDLNAFKTRGLSDSDLLSMGDLNNDGTFSNADIESLISLLNGTATSGATTVATPEPSTFALAFIGVALLAVSGRTLPHGPISAECSVRLLASIHRTKHIRSFYQKGGGRKRWQ